MLEQGRMGSWQVEGSGKRRIGAGNSRSRKRDRPVGGASFGEGCGQMSQTGNPSVSKDLMRGAKSAHLKLWHYEKMHFAGRDLKDLLAASPLSEKGAAF